MKKLKKMFVVLAALALCFVPVFGSKLTAQAAEPVTYSVRYLADKNDWKYQFGPWTDNGSYYSLETLSQYIKDGDMITIDNLGSDQGVSIKVDVSLSSVTVVNSNVSIVTAKSIDNVYALNSSSIVINGHVKNAYVYNRALANFNNKVDYLELIDTTTENSLHVTIGANDTVGHVRAYSDYSLFYEGYNFAAGKLSVIDGTLKTAEADYSKTPVAATPAPANPSTPSAPSTPSTGGEYDEVPKTADMRFNPLWLILISAVCMTGSHALKKSK